MLPRTLCHQRPRLLRVLLLYVVSLPLICLQLVFLPVCLRDPRLPFPRLLLGTTMLSSPLRAIRLLKLSCGGCLPSPRPSIFRGMRPRSRWRLSHPVSSMFRDGARTSWSVFGRVSSCPCLSYLMTPLSGPVSTLITCSPAILLILITVLLSSIQVCTHPAASSRTVRPSTALSLCGASHPPLPLTSSPFCHRVRCVGSIMTSLGVLDAGVWATSPDTALPHPGVAGVLLHMNLRNVPTGVCRLQLLLPPPLNLCLRRTRRGGSAYAVYSRVSPCGTAVAGAAPSLVTLLPSSRRLLPDQFLPLPRLLHRTLPSIRLLLPSRLGARRSRTGSPPLMPRLRDLSLLTLLLPLESPLWWRPSRLSSSRCLRLLRGWMLWPLALTGCVGCSPVLAGLPQVDPLPLLSGLLPPGLVFVIDSHLNLLSWNVCGVTRFDKLLQLKAFVFSRHPSVIFLQEAFPGRPDPAPQAPSLPGYIPYVHLVRNGLLAYFHSSLTHRLLRTSTGPDVTFQLFKVEVEVGGGVLQLCNV